MSFYAFPEIFIDTATAKPLREKINLRI